MAIHVAINRPTLYIYSPFVSLFLSIICLQSTINVSSPQLFYLRQFWQRGNRVFKLS